MLVGIGNATTDATPMQLYSETTVYLLVTLACIFTVFRSERWWLGWLAVLIGWAPVLYLFAPIYG